MHACIHTNTHIKSHTDHIQSPSRRPGHLHQVMHVHNQTRTHSNGYIITLTQYIDPLTHSPTPSPSHTFTCPHSPSHHLQTPFHRDTSLTSPALTREPRSTAVYWSRFRFKIGSIEFIRNYINPGIFWGRYHLWMPDQPCHQRLPSAGRHICQRVPQQGATCISPHRRAPFGYKPSKWKHRYIMWFVK